LRTAFFIGWVAGKVGKVLGCGEYLEW